MIDFPLASTPFWGMSVLLLDWIHAAQLLMLVLKRSDEEERRLNGSALDGDLCLSLVSVSESESVSRSFCFK